MQRTGLPGRDDGQLTSSLFRLDGEAERSREALKLTDKAWTGSSRLRAVVAVN